MSAVSNITYVYAFDFQTGTSPFGSSGNYIFSNYNEAMSFGKWMSLQTTTVVWYVWNYNGGSGYWLTDAWNPRGNSNWP